MPVAVDTTGVLAGKPITGISAGGYHACALAGGAVFCWGYNIVGQLGNNTTTNSAVAVPVVTSGVLSGKRLVQAGNGSNHSCVMAGGGKAYCWGFYTGGQLGNGTTANSSVPVEVSGFG